MRGNFITVDDLIKDLDQYTDGSDVFIVGEIMNVEVYTCFRFNSVELCASDPFFYGVDVRVDKTIMPSLAVGDKVWVRGCLVKYNFSFHVRAKVIQKNRY